MTRFYLSRHGETVWHAENRYAGRTDIAMTNRGKEQADLLARWASSVTLDAIYSSDLSRAVATAEPAAASAGMEVQEDARLREVDFGQGEGLTRGEMAEVFPEELKAFMTHPGTVPLPGGEPGPVAVARAVEALVNIAGKHPDGAVLIVMHTTLMRLLLCHMLGISLDEYRTVFPRVYNAGITEVEFTNGRWALISFNLSNG